MRQNASFLCLSFLVLLSLQADAAVIDSYTAATNDRFTNSASFIGAGFNLSGVGQISSSPGGNNNGFWATLISPNVVVSAFHAASPAGSVVNFYASNDPGSVAVQRTITSNSVRIGSTDLWLAVLNSNVPTSIKSYNYSNTLLTGTPPDANGNFFISNAGALQDQNAFIVGRSPENFPAFQSQAIGRNEITGFSENVPFNGTDNDALILAYDAPGSAKYVQYEARLVEGDSGAPLFVESNGELLLLGTNAFRITNLDGSPFGSGVNYIGNQSSFVSDFVSINAVPEPSSICLAAFAAIAGLIICRRQRSTPAIQSIML